MPIRLRNVASSHFLFATMTENNTNCRGWLLVFQAESEYCIMHDHHIILSARNPKTYRGIPCHHFVEHHLVQNEGAQTSLRGYYSKSIVELRHRGNRAAGKPPGFWKVGPACRSLGEEARYARLPENFSFEGRRKCRHRGSAVVDIQKANTTLMV